MTETERLIAEILIYHLHKMWPDHRAGVDAGIPLLLAIKGHRPGTTHRGRSDGTRTMTTTPKRKMLVTALTLFLLSVADSATAASDETRLPSFTNAAGSRMPCGSCRPPAELRAETEIARQGEPGERLNISGTIYQHDGVTPAEGTILFLYHTDATGYYNKEDDAFNPRLRGWVKTGKDGRYAFKTIKPGPYPGRDTPAHIHVHLFSASIPEHSIAEFRFDDDRRLPAKEREEGRARGQFSPVVHLTRANNGAWQGARDIKL